MRAIVQQITALLAKIELSCAESESRILANVRARNAVFRNLRSRNTSASIIILPLISLPLKELRSGTEDPLHRGDRAILKLYRREFCRTTAHQIAGKPPNSLLMSNARRLSSSYSVAT